jgi:hypothetical protein
MKILAVTALLAFSATPAFATGKPESTPPQGTGPSYAPGNPNPGPNAPLPEKAKAYGRYCQGESKKHEKGEKGTAFSRCVTNMAQTANGLTPAQSCKGESKKHEKGEKGTAYSRCVKAAARLRHDHEQEGQV